MMYWQRGEIDLPHHTIYTSASYRSNLADIGGARRDPSFYACNPSRLDGRWRRPVVRQYVLVPMPTTSADRSGVRPRSTPTRRAYGQMARVLVARSCETRCEARRRHAGRPAGDEHQSRHVQPVHPLADAPSTDPAASVFRVSDGAWSRRRRHPSGIRAAGHLPPAAKITQAALWRRGVVKASPASPSPRGRRFAARSTCSGRLDARGRDAEGVRAIFATRRSGASWARIRPCRSAPTPAARRSTSFRSSAAAADGLRASTTLFT